MVLAGPLVLLVAVAGAGGRAAERSDSFATVFAARTPAHGLASEDLCRAKMAVVVASGATSERQAQASVALYIERRGEEARCSGAWVGEHFLTAAHCVRGAEQMVVRLFGSEKATQPARVLAFHPALDVVLLEVDAPSALRDEGRSECAAPQLDGPEWSIRSGSNVSVAVGDEVSVVGFGLRPETMQQSEPLLGYVSQTEKEHFVLRPLFDVGPCVGDSGAPVWGRFEGGPPEVVGILVSGAAHCGGPDRVVRLEAIRDWIQEHLAQGAGR